MRFNERKRSERVSNTYQLPIYCKFTKKRGEALKDRCYNCIYYCEVQKRCRCDKK